MNRENVQLDVAGLQGKFEDPLQPPQFDKIGPMSIPHFVPEKMEIFVQNEELCD